MPVNKRIRVPEFPAFIISFGFLILLRPIPSIIICSLKFVVYGSET